MRSAPICPTYPAGIYLHRDSRGNILARNTISNYGYGIYFDNGPSLNQVYNNNFMAHGDYLQMFASGGSGNVFNQTAPEGGNYWVDYDTPQEGCNDVNADGFCDTPYVFTGGQDNMPITGQNAGNCTTPVLSLGMPGNAYWATYADYQNQELSIDWMITNHGDSIASNVSLIANYHSNGVVTTSELPINLGNLDPNGDSAVATIKASVPPGVESFHSWVFAEAK